MADESAKGQRLGIRLFLEGIEVPVIKASVRGSLMGPAQATISIPVSDGVQKLKPRTLVHLFYFNNNTYHSPVQSSSSQLFKDSAAQKAKSGDMEDPEAIDVTNPHRWHLLFTGEVMGYGYSKQIMGEQVVLECKDFTQYWDDAKIYLGKKGTGSRHFKQALFMGAVVGTRGKKSVIKSHADITKMLRTRPSTVPTLQGLLGGVVHLLESVTGVYHNSTTKKHRGINDFISAAEMRLKLSKTLAVCPTDLSSKTFTKSKKFAKFIKHTVTQMAGTATYTSLIRILLDNIFHVYYPILAPPYMDDSYRASFIKMVPNSHKLDDKATKEEKEAREALKTVRDCLEYRNKQVQPHSTLDDSYGEQNTVHGSDPFHNHKVAAEGRTIETHDSQKITKWKKKKLKKVPDASKFKDALERVEKMKLSDNLTAKDKTQLSQLLRKTQLAVQSVHNMGSAVEKGYTEPIFGSKHPFYPNMTERNMLSSVKALEDAELVKIKHRPKYKPKQMEMPLNDRLYLTGFCPNIWMCPPPTCNVIFPDQYTALRYSRSWMTEPTRLWLYGMKASGRANMSVKYFAPNTNIIIGPSKGDVAKAAAGSKSFLLHHELFTGVVASFEGAGQGKELLKQMKETDKEAKKYGEGLTNLYKFGSKNKALDRTATTKFLSSRYMNRSATVNGTFNPGLVIGLPAAVINPDRRPGMKGKHLLGVISTVVHNISQQGAATQVKLNWLREYDEGLELFDPNVDKTDAEATIVKDIPKWRGGKVKSDKPIWAEVHGFKYRTRSRLVNVDVTTKETDAAGNTVEKVKQSSKRTRVKYTVWYPIVGMMGLTGRKGRHITQGLAAQKSNTVGADGKEVPGALELASGLDTSYADGVTQENFYDPFDAVNYANYAARGETATGITFTPDAPGSLGPLVNDTNIVGGPTVYTTERAVVAAQFKWSYYVVPKRYAGQGLGGFGGELGTKDAEGKIIAYGPRAINPAMRLDRGTAKNGEIQWEHKYRKRLPWMSARALAAVEVNAYRSGKGSGGKREWRFTFEQVARPAWLHKTYLNQNIGSNYYGPILGCRSIVDTEFHTDLTSALDKTLAEGYELSETPSERVAAPFKDNKTLTPAQIKAIAQSRAQGKGEEVDSARKELADMIGEILADPVHAKKAVVKISVKRGQHTKEVLLPAAVLGGRPIQLSVGQLAAYYQFLQVGEGTSGARDFVDRYTVRKHASMVDIFGWGWIPGELTWEEKSDWTGDNPQLPGTERKHATDSSIPVIKRGIVGTMHLQPSELYAGSSWLTRRDWGALKNLSHKEFSKVQKLSNKKPEMVAKWEREMYTAREGFHSQAFGPLENLALLEHESLYDITGKKKRKLNPKADPRQERYAAVSEYKEALAKLQYINDDSITV